MIDRNARLERMLVKDEIVEVIGRVARGTRPAAC